MLYDTTFPLFSRMLYDVVLVWPPHATLLYSVVLVRVKKCCIVLYEMLHSFGHSSVKHDQTTCNNVQQCATMCNKGCMMFHEILWSFGRGLTLANKDYKNITCSSAKSEALHRILFHCWPLNSYHKKNSWT